MPDDAAGDAAEPDFFRRSEKNLAPEALTAGRLAGTRPLSRRSARADLPFAGSLRGTVRRPLPG